MKIFVKIITSTILFVVCSAQVHSSEQELMKSTYLKIYSVIEFVETNIKIEEACAQVLEQPELQGPFSIWKKTNISRLESILSIKILYEAKAIEIAGDRARAVFDGQKVAVHTRAQKTATPFNRGNPAQISKACQNWSAAMTNTNSIIQRRIAAEIGSIIDSKTKVVAAINNGANW